MGSLGWCYEIAWCLHIAQMHLYSSRQGPSHQSELPNPGNTAKAFLSTPFASEREARAHL